MTAEDPVEYELDGVGQVQIKDDIGLSLQPKIFFKARPEIILVGEMRDKAVDIGLKAALTGHLVLAHCAPVMQVQQLDCKIWEHLII